MLLQYSTVSCGTLWEAHKGSALQRSGWSECSGTCGGQTHRSRLDTQHLTKRTKKRIPRSMTWSVYQTYWTWEYDKKIWKAPCLVISLSGKDKCHVSAGALQTMETAFCRGKQVAQEPWRHIPGFHVLDASARGKQTVDRYTVLNVLTITILAIYWNML